MANKKVIKEKIHVNHERLCSIHHEFYYLEIFNPDALWCSLVPNFGA